MMRGRPHGCLLSAEAPGVFLIRSKAGSHYWALDAELIVSLTPSVESEEDTVRGGDGACVCVGQHSVPFSCKEVLKGHFL